MRGLFYFTKMEASVTMREITVYNTMTRQKEVFNPVTPGEAKMYVCGVTPYNHPHIGNARPFVTWDVIRRYMKHVGYKVTYIEDATASVNNGGTYEMKDLDIVDFIGCILDWSGQVEVLYLDEFESKN